MNTKAGVVVVLIILLSLACGFASAGRTIPPSNETSTLAVSTRAAAVGSLSAHTDIVYVQGNGNLSDNPPLQPNGEGQSTLSYQEDVMAVSGEVTYAKDSTLDTGPKVANQNNFESDKVMTYNSSGDGTDTGKMIASESILVETAAQGETTGTPGCCPWGTGNDQALAATNDVVVAGSDMVVSEAAVASSADARITSDSISTPVSMDYSVAIEGVNQTPGDPSTCAQGSATAYVSANLQEGLGNGTAVGTQVTYSDVTSASGLFELAKDVSYTSG